MSWVIDLSALMLFGFIGHMILRGRRVRLSAKSFYRSRYSFYFIWTFCYICAEGIVIYLRHREEGLSQQELAVRGWAYAVPFFIWTVACFFEVSKNRMFCPHCSKYVAHEVRWQCGYCDDYNTQTFFDPCPLCRREPEAYICPHCDKQILLTNVTEVTHPARKPTPPPIPVVEDDAQKQFEKEKERREREILLTRLDTELAQVAAQKDLYKGKEKKDKRKMMEEEFAEHRTHRLAMMEIVKRETAFAKEAFKDDPEMMERYLESVQEWKEKYT